MISVRRIGVGRIAGGLLAVAGMLGGSPAVAAVEPVSDGQWFHALLNTAQAHQITQGAGVIVAVIDSGVDASHPDLAGSVIRGANHAEGPGDSFTDLSGHGTAMAGLVVAHGKVKGIAPQAKVLAIRSYVSGALFGVRGTSVALGIRSAIAAGATVISISSGSAGSGGILQEAVEEALAADIVVVAAAGNLPDATKVVYPASHPGVIAAAGVDKDGNRSAISATGPEVVIAAPSDSISSTNTGGGHRLGTGTSDSTAIVAGAVALVRARYPDLKAGEVIRRITATAIDKGTPGRDNEYGYGLLNIVGALTASLPAASQTTLPPSSPAPQPNRGRFPWWLLAIPLGLGSIAIATLLIVRQGRR